MRSDNGPVVSVVVPHRGNDDSLFLCVNAVRSQVLAYHSVELIIVLNEPKKRPLGFDLRDHETLLWEPQYFSYNARNTGIRAATGGVIALTDSDSVPEPLWLENALGHVSRGAQLVAGRIMLTFPTGPLSAPACYEKLYAFDQEKNVRFGRSTTANLVGPSDLFTKFPFETDAATGEDFRWTTQAVATGVTLTYAEEAVVRHPVRESMGELLAKAERVTRRQGNSRSGKMGIIPAFRHYFSVHCVPPSASRRRECSSREKFLASFTSILLQGAKLWFFLRPR